MSDDDVKELMESHDLDQESAEQVKEIMEDLGVDHVARERRGR